MEHQRRTDVPTLSVQQEEGRPPEKPVRKRSLKVGSLWHLKQKSELEKPISFVHKLNTE